MSMNIPNWEKYNQEYNKEAFWVHYTWYAKNCWKNYAYICQWIGNFVSCQNWKWGETYVTKRTYLDLRIDQKMVHNIEQF